MLQLAKNINQERDVVYRGALHGIMEESEFNALAIWHSSVLYLILTVESVANVFSGLWQDYFKVSRILTIGRQISDSEKTTCP
jgi:hypothetical protein